MRVLVCVIKRVFFYYCFEQNIIVLGTEGG